MITYVPPLFITTAQWGLLAISLSRNPNPTPGWGEEMAAKKLLSGEWLLFTCPGGLFAVEKVGRRLYVQALNITKFGWRMRSFRNWMDRLATDMECDTVETTCFDERLAKAMVRIRAKPESWQMVWQVEGRSI